MPTPHPVALGILSPECPGELPAPSGRSTGSSLEAEIGIVTNHVLLSSLLDAVQGLVAVLNEHRQILALNDRLLQSLGAEHLSEVLGLRLGETLRCPHALQAKDGCGTTAYCHTCGAAIAQVVALTEDRPYEQLCAIELRPGGAASSNLFVRVRVAPISFAGHRHLLLFLEDVSQEQRSALLEQAFLHDLSNTAMGLSAGVSLLTHRSPEPDPMLSAEVLQLAERLTREIELQRCLIHSTLQNFKHKASALPVERLFSELAAALRHHPSAEGHSIEFIPPTEPVVLQTDATILQRILTNMLINALEATPVGGQIRISSSRSPGLLRLAVWNPGYIPSTVAIRIFQRNFSTKGKLGRGLGTYAMKLLGESLLGGRVSFQSTPDEGTCFTLELPV